MSYSEKDGQVILTMSREDYKQLIRKLNPAQAQAASGHDEHLINRLLRQEGNPHYTPYQVPK